MNKDILNVMGSFSETALDCIEKQNEEIEQLQNNWNELKERLKEEQKICSAHDNRIGFNFIELVLDKMQEIESRK